MQACAGPILLWRPHAIHGRTDRANALYRDDTAAPPGDTAAMTSRQVASHPRGFALVIVLWSLGMLALLGTQMTATTRVQLHLAAQARDQAMAEQAADGTIRQAAFILLGGGRLGAAGTPMHIRIGDVEVAFSATDEAAKIDPNAASKDVWRALLVAVGVDPARATILAGEIADWRTRTAVSSFGGAKIDLYRDRGLPYGSADHPFYSVDEIGLVPDMTPDILARLRPWLSVYHEGDVDDPGTATLAGVAVADAGNSKSGGRLFSGNIVMRVTAVAAIPGRARFVRSAVVRIRADPDAEAETAGDLVQILTWE
jgi:general secretion pathway protein K